MRGGGEWEKALLSSSTPASGGQRNQTVIRLNEGFRLGFQLSADPSASLLFVPHPKIVAGEPDPAVETKPMNRRNGQGAGRMTCGPCVQGQWLGVYLI